MPMFLSAKSFLETLLDMLSSYNLINCNLLSCFFLSFSSLCLHHIYHSHFSIIIQSLCVHFSFSFDQQDSISFTILYLQSKFSSTPDSRFIISEMVSYLLSGSTLIAGKESMENLNFKI